MMKVAILYICTGRYAQFFDGFYKSAEQYLLQGVEKRYFVFTDQEQLTEAANVELLIRPCRGFPEDSLFRFDRCGGRTVGGAVDGCAPPRLLRQT